MPARESWLTPYEETYARTGFEQSAKERGTIPRDRAERLAQERREKTDKAALWRLLGAAVRLISRRSL